MKWKILDLQTWLNLISAFIMLVGLGSAMLIYRAAENDPKGVLRYEEEGGSVYPIMPGESKKYLRDMELYGGKANVIADEVRRWVVGYGTGNLLHTSWPALRLLHPMGFFYAASHLPSRQDSDVGNENNIDRTNEGS